VYAVLPDHSATPAQLPVPDVGVEELEEPVDDELVLAEPPAHALTVAEALESLTSSFMEDE